MGRQGQNQVCMVTVLCLFSQSLNSLCKFSVMQISSVTFVLSYACYIFVLCAMLFNTVDVHFLFGRVLVQRVSENLLKTQKRVLALHCL